MPFQIDGIAVVTGAGSGIGKACALAYAAEGARGVVVADLNFNAATQVAQESRAIAINKEFIAVPIIVDITNTSSVEKMISAAVEHFGRIDYLVNSAGIGTKEHRTVDQADLSQMNRFWQVNVIGTVNCIQAATRVMKNQDIATVNVRGATRQVGRGVILNLGSANSYMATREGSPYIASKHAVMGLTKSPALDLAQHQIRVNAICPGWTRTPMLEDAMNDSPNLSETMMNSVVPLGRTATPEEIADVVVFTTSPRSSYVTGVGCIVDGGATLQVKTY
ncbi:uncharacterized protein F4822DRAFT_393758 [Hypoxylon trugodes]|uniref:uncharacterized protein n=1 Tax=Hypoxylon trugodes TaxID=326681 RepID=UPI0021933DB3|nr:uncharacterized protein F4822DRAFT_393758 [Hypoxylon trugodes]KAI1390621.1 hypothetical protein F4822DRAFT_393758 [Hypoxylon trugodes]